MTCPKTLAMGKQQNSSSKLFSFQQMQYHVTVNFTESTRLLHSLGESVHHQMLMMIPDLKYLSLLCVVCKLR